MEQIREVARTIVLLIFTLAIIYAGLNLITLNTFFVPALSNFFGWIHETTAGTIVGIVIIVLACWPIKTSRQVKNIVVRRKITNEQAQKTLTK